MNLNKYLIRRKLYIWILIIISCIYIIMYFHTSTTFDEKYTLLLINHKFLNLINLDSLDVHPPLYYIILRYYLILTTFWTKSIIIKILFARLLSLIFSVITFIYVCKIFIYFKIHFNYIYLWLLFILLPNVLNSYDPYTLEPLIDIRMYSLAAMVIVMELYYLVTIRDYITTRKLIIIIILMTLSMYTHYFAAIISVIMIFIFIMKFILTRYKIIYHKLFFVLFISLILYLPWMPFLYRQISVPKNDTFNMGRLGTLVGIIKFVVICIVLYLPLMWAKKHLNKSVNELQIEISCTLFLTIIFISSVLLVIRPMFNLRYMYPIIIIYELLSLTILFNYILNKHVLIYFICLLSLLMVAIWSMHYQVADIDIPSIKIEKGVKKINDNDNNKIIKLRSKYSKAQFNPKITGKNHQYNVDGTPINFEYAFLLSNTNKEIYAKHLHNYFRISQKPAYRPVFRHIYSHIYPY